MVRRAIERRRFPRVAAPVLWRPAGWLSQRRRARNVSLGGICVLADTPHRIGRRIELELWLPDGPPVEALARVVWCDALPPKAPARYELGLEWLTLTPRDRARLAQVLQGD